MNVTPEIDELNDLLKWCVVQLLLEEAKNALYEIANATLETVVFLSKQPSL